MFYGIVAGTRGLCLVLASLPHNWVHGEYTAREVTVLTQQQKLYSFLEEDPEGTFWERISENSDRAP